jgi:hydroxymethylpyrimidine pyrophosphatase-like HAD family hydrolase
VIFAIDFDGTIVKEEWPGIGPLLPGAAEALREIHAMGHTIIIWTLRSRSRLREAVDFMRANDIPFDYVNENCAALLDKYKSDCRKVAADVYVDDRGIGKWTWADVIERARAGR